MNWSHPVYRSLMKAYDVPDETRKRPRSDKSNVEETVVGLSEERESLKLKKRRAFE